MKLFLAGPVQMYESTLSMSRVEHPYFRSSDFSVLMKNNEYRLKKVLGDNSSSHLLFLTMSGTGAMEATVFNCLSKNDKCLVVNGGTFGKRFCQILDNQSIPFDSIDLKWNECLSQDHLKKYTYKGYTAFLVNIHETSSGKLYDLDLISSFCKENNLFLIVDAISSFLADEFNMSKFGVDVAIISSQKGLCCHAGLSVVALSERMNERLLEIKNKLPIYYDFISYIKNMDRRQTPFTPASSIVYEIDDMLSKIESVGGIQRWLKTIKERATFFRKQAKEHGFVVPDYSKSTMLTPIYFDKANAQIVVNELREKYDIYITPCGGELADRLVRVGHLGDLSLADYSDLCEKMVHVVKKI